MTDDLHVREALDAWVRAEEPTTLDVYGGAVQVGRRLQRRRRLTALAGAVPVVIAAVLAVSVLTPPGEPAGDRVTTASGDIPGWPTRGDLAEERALLADAMQVWDDETGVAHRDVRALYAGQVPTGDVVVLLAGRVGSGQARLALLGGPPMGGRIFLADEALPVGPVAQLSAIGAAATQQPFTAPPPPFAGPGGPAAELAGPPPLAPAPAPLSTLAPAPQPLSTLPALPPPPPPPPPPPALDPEPGPAYLIVVGRPGSTEAAHFPDAAAVATLLTPVDDAAFVTELPPDVAAGDVEVAGAGLPRTRSNVTLDARSRPGGQAEEEPDQARVVVTSGRTRDGVGWELRAYTDRSNGQLCTELMSFGRAAGSCELADGLGLSRGEGLGLSQLSAAFPLPIVRIEVVLADGTVLRPETQDAPAGLDTNRHFAALVRDLPAPAIVEVRGIDASGAVEARQRFENEPPGPPAPQPVLTP